MAKKTAKRVSTKKPASKKPATKKAAAKKPATKKVGSKTADASVLIDKRIAELADWRGAMLAQVRDIIRSVDAQIIEAWKWRGTPVWELGGILCTGETYKSVVKLTFAKGAALKDAKRLFNASLEGNVRRAIDVREGEKIDAPALRELVREAVSLNTRSKRA